MDKIKKVMIAIENNNMCAYYAETKSDVINVISELLKEGESVAVGGSVSLAECGVLDFLRNGNYNFIDRYKPDLTADEIRDVFVSSFGCDTYLCSTNAITLKGELYSVDGNGNRVAAMIYGPKSVVVVVGKNKIVSDLDEAIKRVKTIAAPKNSKRLGCSTYCEKTGNCISLKNEDGYMCDGCDVDNRICSNYIVMAKQRNKNRVKVIIVNEDIGY